jgi:2'-5' RNA ligase
LKSNIFIALLPSHDNRLSVTQKIHACEAKRSALVKVQWTPINDLHFTLGYIRSVDEKDIRLISMGMSLLSQTIPFMASGEEIRLYGNAIVLRLEPYQNLLAIHKKLNQKLIELSENQYHFDVKGRFDPHLTLGRIKNLPALNPLHRQQFLSLLSEQIKSPSFLIQQGALLRRNAENVTPGYQILHLYPLRG